MNIVLFSAPHSGITSIPKRGDACQGGQVTSHGPRTTKLQSWDLNFVFFACKYAFLGCRLQCVPDDNLWFHILTVWWVERGVQDRVSLSWSRTYPRLRPHPRFLLLPPTVWIQCKKPHDCDQQWGCDALTWWESGQSILPSTVGVWNITECRLWSQAVRVQSPALLLTAVWPGAHYLLVAQFSRLWNGTCSLAYLLEMLCGLKEPTSVKHLEHLAYSKCHVRVCCFIITLIYGWGWRQGDLGELHYLYHIFLSLLFYLSEYGFYKSMKSLKHIF